MLTRLTGKDVVGLWPLIDKAIDTAIDRNVTNHSNDKNRILLKILEGKIVCWLSKKTAESIPCGIAMTVIMEDDILAGKSLLLYLLSSIGQRIQADDFVEAFDGLSKYARSIGCRRFIFYTQNKKILRLVQTFVPGLNTQYYMGIAEL